MNSTVWQVSVQIMLGLPVEAAVASNQPDRYGTTSINRQDHNRRHHAVLKIWSDLLSMVHGDNYDANPAADDNSSTSRTHPPRSPTAPPTTARPAVNTSSTTPR